MGLREWWKQQTDRTRPPSRHLKPSQFTERDRSAERVELAGDVIENSHLSDYFDELDPVVPILKAGLDVRSFQRANDHLEALAGNAANVEAFKERELARDAEQAERRTDPHDASNHSTGMTPSAVQAQVAAELTTPEPEPGRHARVWHEKAVPIVEPPPPPGVEQR